MDEATLALVQIRVGRADEELRAAQALFEDRFYRIACSRAYFAAFLMTSAVLLTLDVTRAKHSGIEAAFHEMFIKTGRVEVEYGRLYTLLRKTREDSDYNERTIVTEEMARQRLADAERLVGRLREYLQAEGAIE